MDEKTIEGCYAKLWELLFQPPISTVELMYHSIIRSAQLTNKAFFGLTNQENYICAIPLLRNMVDICLSTFAYDLAPDPDKFWINFMKEKPQNQSETNKEMLAHYGVPFESLVEKGIVSLVNKDGKRVQSPLKLTDRFLYETLDLLYPGIKKIYKHCCKYVHFTDKQFRSCLFTEIKGQIKIKSIEDCQPLDYSKEEIFDDMYFANKVLIDRIYMYYEQKQRFLAQYQGAKVECVDSSETSDSFKQIINLLSQQEKE